MVLLGSVPDPEDEAFENSAFFKLAVEESELDEPKLGKAGLDKPEQGLDKSELVLVDFRHFKLKAAISGLEEVIELDDSLRWAEVSQSFW
ncbi:hypothetical protein Tco_0943900 [Tanacetum coccineum]